MFDFVNKANKRRVEPSIGFGRCSCQIFKPVANGVVLSNDFKAIGSNFIDYSGDRLVAAGVDVASPSRPIVDVSLNTLDNVEKQTEKIFEVEYQNTKKD